MNIENFKEYIKEVLAEEKEEKKDKPKRKKKRKSRRSGTKARSREPAPTEPAPTPAPTEPAPTPTPTEPAPTPTSSPSDEGTGIPDWAQAGALAGGPCYIKGMAGIVPGPPENREACAKMRVLVNRSQNRRIEEVPNSPLGKDKWAEARDALYQKDAFKKVRTILGLDKSEEETEEEDWEETEEEDWEETEEEDWDDESGALTWGPPPSITIDPVPTTLVGALRIRFPRTPVEKRAPDWKGIEYPKASGRYWPEGVLHYGNQMFHLNKFMKRHMGYNSWQEYYSAHQTLFQQERGLALKPIHFVFALTEAWRNSALTTDADGDGVPDALAQSGDDILENMGDSDPSGSQVALYRVKVGEFKNSLVRAGNMTESEAEDKISDFLVARGRLKQAWNKATLQGDMPKESMIKVMQRNYGGPRVSPDSSTGVAASRGMLPEVWVINRERTDGSTAPIMESEIYIPINGEYFTAGEKLFSRRLGVVIGEEE
jgi:hypothetical protein